MLYSVFNDHAFRLTTFSVVVGSSGLEPPTSRLSGARSNLLSYEPISSSVRSLLLHSGGDDGIRTHDPLLAGQVLSQLSYTPFFVKGPSLNQTTKRFPRPSGLKSRQSLGFSIFENSLAIMGFRSFRLASA